MPSPPRPTRARVAAHRAGLRARGLRPVQIWLPDTRAPGFAAEARRQARLVDAGAGFDDIMDFLERAEGGDAEDDEPRAPG